MFKSLMLAAVLVVGGVAYGSGPAQAATLSCTTSPGGSGATIWAGNVSAAACFVGNDTNTITDTTEIFGLKGWTLAAKSDGPGGDGAIAFTKAPVTGAKSGEWALSNPQGFEKVILTLKSGNGFAAFLLERMFCNWGSSKALSHASVYYVQEDVAPVPLPASALMLVAAMGGLAALRRRRPA
jgi:hypothetical protein